MVKYYVVEDATNDLNFNDTNSPPTGFKTERLLPPSGWTNDTAGIVPFSIGVAENNGNNTITLSFDEFKLLRDAAQSNVRLAKVLERFTPLIFISATIGSEPQERSDNAQE